jgi:TatD DNase family protein
MTILIDVHAHLDWPDMLQDIDNVIQRAREAGVKVIIANGVDRESNRRVLELAGKYDIVQPALGIYPIDALQTEQGESFKETDIDKELDFIKQQDIIAIGEVGLDMKNGQDLEMQKDLFLKLINIAKEKDIPVIVHSRKAEQECIDVLEATGYKKVVMHCFSGRKHLIKRAADLGYYFSIPTNIVKSEHFQQLVKDVHISKLLTETDAPFLSPFPGKTNEPAFVIESLKKIAEIKGMTLDDTANNIFMNYQNLFLR